MLRRLGLVLLAVSLVTAGCLGLGSEEEEPEESEDAETSANQAGGENQSADGESIEELSASAPPEDERGFNESPQLRVGEWWTIELSSQTYGVEAEATVVVAGMQEGRYMLGMPSEDFTDEAILLHLPPLGPVHPSTLGYPAHEATFEPVSFPMEEGQTWSTEWYTGALDAEVVEADGEQARIEFEGGADIEVSYDPQLGLPESITVADTGGYTVVDHGFGYEGQVTVPWNPEIIFLNGRLAGVLDTQLGPAAPMEEIEVEGPYDRASIALLMGNLLVEGPPGAYQVSATAPDGSTYEDTFTPTPGGEQLRIVPANSQDPVGTWQMEYTAAGGGIAAAEGIGYEALAVDLP